MKNVVLIVIYLGFVAHSNFCFGKEEYTYKYCASFEELSRNHQINLNEFIEKAIQNEQKFVEDELNSSSYLKMGNLEPDSYLREKYLKVYSNFNTASSIQAIECCDKYLNVVGIFFFSFDKSFNNALRCRQFLLFAQEEQVCKEYLFECCIQKILHQFGLQEFHLIINVSKGVTYFASSIESSGFTGCFYTGNEINATKTLVYVRKAQRGSILNGFKNNYAFIK